MWKFFTAVLVAIAMLTMPTGAAQAASLSDMTEITGVRVSTSSDKVRVVVDAKGDVTYKKMVLKNPGRVVIDIQNAWLSSTAIRQVEVGSSYASRVRMGQFNKTTVRVVVETEVGAGGYNVFAMDSPARLVMDFGNVSASQSYEPGPATSSDDDNSEPAVAPAMVEPVNQPADETAKSDSNSTPVASSNDDEDSRSISNITGLQGKVITIDPGHGGSDPGAIGPSGVKEKDVTLKIALEVARLLRAEGAKVIMTRTTDVEVSPRKADATDVEELQARVDIGNANRSDIFISIHMDSFSNRAANGTTGYYYTLGNKKSQQLADRVRAGVIDQLKTQSRGTKTCNFYVCKHSSMPATLVEVAFISNPGEEKLCNSDAGVKKAAQGIADGIEDYFG